AIVPVVIGEEDAALVASKFLEERGFLVTPIRPPTVPAGTSRLRFTFTAEHTEAQVAALVGAVIPLIEDLESMSKITNG
ncbi:MAG: aminotransferase class I/II-fold pyridoxal phosphate-dependent enzyme, partial [Pseudomonadota bacterium]|nr:aminotransferase class I/II-fold pyridoxal phosphate-dependent enzyme [Pseudomonadota bacterium]